MTDYGGFVNVSYSNSFYFTNASNNDMLIYPETSNQSIQMGITSNSASMITVNSNNIILNSSNLIIKGPITTNNNLTYAPIDYGVSNFSIPGFIIGSVPVSASNSFNLSTEGSLYITTNNYVTVPNNIFTTPWWLNGGFTCECWVNYPSFTSVTHSSLPNVPLSMGVFNNTGTNIWSFGPNASGILTFYYFNSTLVSVIGTTVMNTNTWHHIVVSCDATNIRIFLNGSLQATAAISGIPINTLGQFTFGGPYSGGGSGVANMYVTNTRLVYGSALYTTTFIPPIAPLNPSPSGTTALLLRVPQNPGRVLISKIGGTTQLQAYPPVALTGYTTNIQNTSYGAGTYIASSSGEGGFGNRNSWAAFTLQNIASINSWWSSLGTTLGNYNITTGAYSGSPLTSTIDTNGILYIGEWLQIQMPVSITISSYSILPTTNSARAPNTFYLMASKDGINWKCISNVSNRTSWTQNVYTTFNVISLDTYSQYRIIINSIQTGNDGYCSIAQLLFYGTQESINITPDGQVGIGVTNPVQQLEVSGNAIIYGNISTNKIGSINAKVQAYPPVLLTDYLTNVQNTSYGTGIYIASASSELPSWLVFSAFNKGPQTWSSLGTYTTGTYIGSVNTVDISGIIYSGEWIQIQLPVSIVLSRYDVACQFNSLNNVSTSFVVLGSYDGIKWYLLNSQTGQSWSAPGTTNTYVVNTFKAYQYYRMVCRQLVSTGGAFSVMEWILYGTQESINITSDGEVGLGVTNPVQQLEVAGNAIINGNISANNIGIFRNRIINGDMRISQRGISFTTAQASIYILDRWYYEYNNSMSSTITQSTDTPLGLGFSHSLNLTVTTGGISTQYGGLYQYIEGFNGIDFMWGTSQGIPLVLSFWTKLSIASNSIVNIEIDYYGGTTNYAYYAAYTINNANTWEFKTIIIPPPPVASGAFQSTNLANKILAIRFMRNGSVNPNPIANGTWSTTINGYAGGININLGTSLTYSYFITGVQLEKGTIATPFEFRPYAFELQLCHRYLVHYNYTNGERFGMFMNSSGTIAFAPWTLPVIMRTVPIISVSSSISANGTITAINTAFSASGSNAQNIFLTCTCTSTSGTSWFTATAANQFITFSAEL